MVNIASVGSACFRAVVVFPGPGVNTPEISHEECGVSLALPGY